MTMIHPNPRAQARTRPSARAPWRDIASIAAIVLAVVLIVARSVP
jgi:hypothetical protein